MKKIILSIWFILPFIVAYGQNSAEIETPKIITKLKIGNTANFGDKSIKFIKVTEDSRCPTDMMCVWAGEAKIIIAIYKGNTLIEEKKLVFGDQNINPDQIKELLTTPQKTIFGYKISPYPSSKTPITSSEYYLELLLQ
ncbi:hypothetical protein [Aquimarina aquimarini]|uniref:hypothetical protein n=1 Tax=Aquimarina aquimarini TaxID=1191734 RepID=UPI000D54F7C7|nr:hypothetical protein [Aquimarina aquimarini]